MQHPELMTDTLTLLATHGWQRSDKLEFADAALHSLRAKFAVPLRNAKVDKEDSVTIWWKLFNSAYGKKWPNILTLVELLFCFPMSNGRVEHTFSALKRVKTAVSIIPESVQQQLFPHSVCQPTTALLRTYTIAVKGTTC